MIVLTANLQWYSLPLQGCVAVLLAGYFTAPITYYNFITSPSRAFYKSLLNV